MGEAVSRIEAALQAGLGGSGGKRPDLARQALAGTRPETDVHLEAWLEAVAAELQSNAAVLVPEDMGEAIAARMTADPRRSIGAHAKIEDDIIRNLIRRT